MNKAKTIQIAAMLDNKGHEVLYALRDDGTIWRRHDVYGAEGWKPIEAIPDGPPETPVIPAV